MDISGRREFGAAMSKLDLRSLPPLSQWQVDVLRLTAFPTPAAKFEEPKWWTELTGKPPEVRNVRPAKKELTEEGPFDQGKLTMQVQPLRIDWNYSQASEEKPDDLIIPTVGSFTDVADKFVKLMLTWLSPSIVPPLRRLAFGAVLLQPVEDRTKGYELLANYLPSVDLSSDSSDFIYQINRPRSSQLGLLTDRKLNRLSKWSCGAFQRAQVQLSPEATAKMLGEKQFACRLELDINTSADYKDELPKQKLADLFRELFELGKEIATKGDIL